MITPPKATKKDKFRGGEVLSLYFRAHGCRTSSGSQSSLGGGGGVEGMKGLIIHVGQLSVVASLASYGFLQQSKVAPTKA